MDESLRRKAVRKKLQVSFDDGTVICYKNATTTFIEVIKKIGPEVAEGWWVNTQSDSSQKYLQLLAIKNRLSMTYEVKLAEEFDSYTESDEKKERGKKDNFGVTFEDGTKAHGENSTVVYRQAIEILGADRIAAKGFEWKGNEVVTRFKKYNGQIQLKNGLWVYIPNLMKDFIGVWTVSQVEAHDITSDKDRIMSTQAASPCFFVGEQMEFQKTKVIPCPTSTENIRQYEEFPGTFDYIYDGKKSCITFPEVNYFSSFTDPNTGYSSASSYTIYEITYKVSLHDQNTLFLSGERYEYDNLGNSKRCYKADIILKR